MQGIRPNGSPKSSVPVSTAGTPLLNSLQSLNLSQSTFDWTDHGQHDGEASTPTKKIEDLCHAKEKRRT